MKTFKCPNGIDPATGQAFRCSYGMNYVNGGPNGKSLVYLTDGNGASNILIVWDHGKTPRVRGLHPRGDGGHPARTLAVSRHD
ncbi:hypothetical protein J0H58_24055 [bacterium]|nr:hypothetical protein [bacterium]